MFKIANSFQYIDELGYYYILLHNDSITKTKYDDTNNANQIIYSIFLNIKFLYEKTKYFVYINLSKDMKDIKFVSII